MNFKRRRVSPQSRIKHKLKIKKGKESISLFYSQAEIVYTVKAGL